MSDTTQSPEVPVAYAVEATEARVREKAVVYCVTINYNEEHNFLKLEHVEWALDSPSFVDISVHVYKVSKESVAYREAIVNSKRYEDD